MLQRLDGMKIFRTAWLLMVFAMLWVHAMAQSEYMDRQFQFLSFEAIPTWTGVATDWDKAKAQLHLYDSERYRGHSQYISVALKTGITFAQFKEQVRNPAKRKYIPFFLFDLRANPPEIDGKDFDWALRMEDYVYQDNAEQMTATTLRMLHAVTDMIKVATGRSTHGIIILSTNLQSQPNINIAPALNRVGFPNMTVNQLLTRMGGKAVHILNAGTGYGYLRYVKAGEETSFKATNQDIVVYERMPARVPPVNGIVTLEPQTPLSHVNLLAKNRGTFNLYALNFEAVPGLKSHVGKLVKMECTASKIAIHDSKLAEAEAFWAKQHKAISIVSADTSFGGLVELGKLGDLHQKTINIGAKAANYALLQQQFPQYVRPGYAIPFQLYSRMMKSCGAVTSVDSLMRNKAGKDAQQINDCLEAIRKAIVSQHERLALRRSLIEADAQIERGEFVTPEESDEDIEELARRLQAR